MDQGGLQGHVSNEVFAGVVPAFVDLANKTRAFSFDQVANYLVMQAQMLLEANDVPVHGLCRSSEKPHTRATNVQITAASGFQTAPASGPITRSVFFIDVVI